MELSGSKKIFKIGFLYWTIIQLPLELNPGVPLQDPMDLIWVSGIIKTPIESITMTMMLIKPSFKPIKNARAKKANSGKKWIIAEKAIHSELISFGSINFLLTRLSRRIKGHS